MPVYYQQPQDDFIARFLASMQERAAAQRAMESEPASQKELIDYQNQLELALADEKQKIEAATKQEEERRKAHQLDSMNNEVMRLLFGPSMEDPKFSPRTDPMVENAPLCAGNGQFAYSNARELCDGPSP